jgi:hypothetical protein
VGRTAAVVLVLLAAAVALPGDARALDCPFIPLERRLEGADAAFVGELVSQRPLADGGSLARFEVRQQIRGTGGSEVEVRSEAPLTDAEDRPLTAGTVVGVFAELDGATLTTSSCLLTDPAALLAVSDEPRGGLIKIALGVAFTMLVVGWAIVRRRRGTRPELPGTPGV